MMMTIRSVVMAVTNRMRSTATSFLAELIIVVFFLVVSTSIIMQVFAVAETKRSHAVDLNAASLVAQEAAEVFKQLKAGDDLSAHLQHIDAHLQADEGDFLLYYDHAWQPTEQVSARVLRLELQEPETVAGGAALLYRARISVWRDEAELISFDTARCLSEGGVRP